MMRTIFTLFVLGFTSFLSAQNRIFQTTLNENQLSETQKVSKGLADTYITTKYYQQPHFDLHSDLEFSLPDGKNIQAKFKKEYSYTNKNQSIIYDVKGQPDADLVLSKVDGIITGMYSSGNGEKIIFHQTDKNIMAVSIVSEVSLIKRDSHVDTPMEDTFAALKANANVCLASTPVCGNSRIDVMVVFTPQTTTQWGGIAQSKSFITTAITNFNTSLVNSGISNVTINLVYCEEIPYVESGNISTDLSRFRTANDGYMDEVANLRVNYGADLCHLVTSTPTNTCGLGNLNTVPTNYSNTAAFSVGLYNCVVSNYTLAHEMGHNMGLNHDWYVNQSTAPCDHHHGYTNKTAITLGTASTTAQRWRTILAYNNECSNAGFNCTRVNRWANPAVNYNSEPTGVPIGSTNPANEAFGFARFACVIADFMPNGVLAINENNTFNAEDLSIYPVPAKDEINVLLKKDGQYHFKITNALGQLMQESTKKTISLQNYPAGQYFLSVYSKENTLIATKKFTVK